MKSTGEVMGVGKTFGEAFVKSQLGAGTKLPRPTMRAKVFLTVKNSDKPRAVEVARAAGRAWASSWSPPRARPRRSPPPASPATTVNKVTEGRPHVVDMIKNNEIALVINTVEERRNAIADSRADPHLGAAGARDHLHHHRRRRSRGRGHEVHGRPGRVSRCRRCTRQLALTAAAPEPAARHRGIIARHQSTPPVGNARRFPFDATRQTTWPPFPSPSAAPRSSRPSCTSSRPCDRPWVINAIAEARAQGDLSENAEYDAAKDRQGFIEGRIQEIEGKLAAAQIIDPAALDAGGRVVFGATVELEEEESGEKVKYQIVGEDEADLKQGLINISSPIARALIGKEEGDTAEVQAPGGIKRYEIVGGQLRLSVMRLDGAAAGAGRRPLVGQPDAPSASWSCRCCSPTCPRRPLAGQMAARLFTRPDLGLRWPAALLLLMASRAGGETAARWTGRAVRWPSCWPGMLLALLAEFAVAPAHRGAREPAAVARRRQRACTLLQWLCAAGRCLWKRGRVGPPARCTASGLTPLFLTDFCLGLARLTLPPGVRRWLPSTRSVLTSGRWPPRLLYLSTLKSRGPGMRSSSLGLFLLRLGPPQHQQLADVLDRRGVRVRRPAAGTSPRARRGRRPARGP